MPATPHKLTVAEVEKALDGWYVVSDTLTADATQIKRLLVAHGRHLFRVDRRYVAELPDGSWGVVYEGDNLSVAVEAHNRLS